MDYTYEKDDLKAFDLCILILFGPAVGDGKNWDWVIGLKESQAWQILVIYIPGGDPRNIISTRRISGNHFRSALYWAAVKEV